MLYTFTMTALKQYIITVLNKIMRDLIKEVTVRRPWQDATIPFTEV